MKLKITAMLLGVALIIGYLAPISAYAASGLGNFKTTQKYAEQFSDVKKTSWYYTDLKNAYEYGLVSGTGTKFNPSGNVTIAEVITFAVRIACIYSGDSLGALKNTDGKNWYDKYIAYAESNGILLSGEFEGSYDKAATRAQMAYIFCGALPKNDLGAINKNFAVIPDMGKSDRYYAEALTLFQAGIVTGSDAYGNFHAGTKLTRAEATALLNRLVKPSQRKSFIPLVGQVELDVYQLTLHPHGTHTMRAIPSFGSLNGGAVIWKTSDPKTATVSSGGIVTALADGTTRIWATDINGKKNSKECAVTVKTADILSDKAIFNKVSPAVFNIICRDKSGENTTYSSGFFVNSDGTAYASLAALDGMYSMTIRTRDGKEYNDVSIIGYNRNTGAAVIKVEGNAFPAVNLGNSEDAAIGSSVYCISSSVDKGNAISNGLVAGKRTDSAASYLQFTASISAESAGGALVNRYGEVIGLVIGSDTAGQNVNFALYVINAKATKNCKVMTLTQFYNKFYSNLPELKAQDLTFTAGENTGFDCPTKLTFGGIATGVLPNTRSIYFYSVRCATSGLLDIVIGSSQSTFDIQVTLMDSEGNTVDQTVVENGTVATARFKIPSPGTYLFSLKPINTLNVLSYCGQSYALYSILLPIND